MPKPPVNAFATTIAGLAALLAIPSVALAQQANPVGQWACQVGYSDYNAQGQSTGGHSDQYMMAVYQGGRYEASGATISAAGTMQWYSEGQWAMQDADTFAAQGSMVDRSGMMPPVLRFAHMGRLDAGGTRMLFENQIPDSTNSYIVTRHIIACERRG